MNDLCQVQITAPDPDWLLGFGRRLVADRLAAAVHVHAPIRAIYVWQGETKDHEESRITLHTRTALVPAISARLDAEHPYEVPGIVALPIVASSHAYAAWVREQTKSE